MVLISMKINNTLLENFDMTILKLKELNILSSKENRTSVVTELMKRYTNNVKGELSKKTIYNNRNIYPSEKGDKLES